MRNDIGLPRDAPQWNVLGQRFVGDDHRGSVGRVDPSRIEIRDTEQRPSPVDDEGAVWFRASAPFEYHDDAHKTATTFDGTGEWYTVGDRGRIDDEGYLYIVDRVKDMVVTGGENVFTTEVENAVISHGAVQDVAVIGIPHEEWGEAVHAVVVVRETGSSRVGDHTYAWEGVTNLWCLAKIGERWLIP